MNKGVGKGGGGGGGGRRAPPPQPPRPPDFKLKLLCVQAFTTKGHPKCIIMENKREKTAFRL